MKPEDVPEEHRKHLEMTDNPSRVSNASIFSLVSEGLIKLQERMGILEVKQSQTYETICKTDTKVEKNTEKIEEVRKSVEDKIHILEDDFVKCQLSGMQSRGENIERNKWIQRAIAAILAVTLATLGLVFWHLGIPFP